MNVLEENKNESINETPNNGQTIDDGVATPGSLQEETDGALPHEGQGLKETIRKTDPKEEAKELEGPEVAAEELEESKVAAEVPAEGPAEPKVEAEELEESKEESKVEAEDVEDPKEDTPVEKEVDLVEPDQSDLGEETTMEDFEETMVSLKSGQLVTGTVLSVNESEVVVNIGYKSDGIVPLDELVLQENQIPPDLFNIGDEIEVEVLKVNDGEGNVILSQKSVENKRAWKSIEKGLKTKEEFEGECVESVKGGVIAKIGGIRAFVPASQLSNRYIEDLSTFVGQTLRLRIIELERGRRRVVASQRIILEEEAAEKRQQVWDSIEVGKKIKGVVKRLTNFGAFVDIGGIDGLIHISDLSWGHVNSPKEVLSEEQDVEVLVLAADPDKERISLGYKQTMPHPWDNVEEKYQAGSQVQGKVVRITSFGAFVELEPGVDGLVHISQVANRRIQKVEDELSVGQMIDVKVLDANSESRRISLSIRELLPQEEKKIDPPKSTKKEEQFQKEDMTVTLGEFFPEDFS